MGLFPIVMRQLKFVIVGIDYFTKWVEAEALATIKEKNMQVLFGGTLSVVAPRSGQGVPRNTLT